MTNSSQQDLNQKLWQACYNGDLPAFNDALDKGADINWKNPDHQELKGYTPLMTACKKGFKSVAKLLLENGATDEGALHVAVQNNHIEVVDLLLASGAVIDKQNEVGATPLHLAASDRNTDMVHFLISKNAGIDKTNKNQYTALHCATLYNSPEVVQLLLKKKANPNTYSDNGFSPFFSAAKIGSKEIIQLLLQWSSSDGERIDVSKAENNGNTALHIASEEAQVEVVKLLVREGNLDKPNEDGDTPLHLASRKGHTHIVEILLDHGANQSIKNKEGKTPKELACDGYHSMTEQELSKPRSFKSGDPSQSQWSRAPLDEVRHGNKQDVAKNLNQCHPVDTSDVMNSLEELNVNMYITNLGAQGYPNTGKTTLLNLVMGKDPPSMRKSTGCADPPSCCLMVKSESSEGIEWDIVTRKKMLEMVADAIKKKISQKQTKMSSFSNGMPKPISQVEIPVSPDIEISQVKGKSSLPVKPTIVPESVLSELSGLPDLLEKVKKSKGDDAVILDSHLMMVTDSGGQPPFLDASALFLRNSSLQIFTCKLSEPLNCRPEFSYFIDGESASFTKSNQHLSYLQIIETMAKLVSAIQPAYTPSAVESPKGVKYTIVGTFEDQAHLCSETIEYKQSTLDELLKHYKDCQVRYGDNLILTVNAITSDKEERKKLATKLRKLIINASDVTIKVVVRLRWFVFLLSMRTMAEKKSRSVLTLEECLELGKLLQMEASEVHEAIRFFHDINLIMHFNTRSLKNSVIVETKPLFDKVTLLLLASFIDATFLADHCSLVLPTGAKEMFKQHGRFNPETLDKFIKFEEPITKEFFLDVLVEVKAVAKITFNGLSEYIMPCALTYKPDEQCVPHPSTPWVIRFRIKRGVEEVFIPLPVGYLPALIVFLLTSFSPQFSLIRKDRQFRNLFVLKYKRGGKVYIVERHLQLEIYFTFCKKLAADCIVIRDCVQKAISLTEYRLRITENAITKVDSFLCSCTEAAHHVCIYNNETGIAECELTDDACVLKAHHLRWIKSDGDTASSSSQARSTTPQGAGKILLGIAALAQVNRFLKNVNNWQDLGLQLGLLQPTLKRIEKEQHGHINDCKREILEAWLLQQDDVADAGVPSCDVLKAALEKIGEKQLASEINNLEKMILLKRQTPIAKKLSSNTHGCSWWIMLVIPVLLAAVIYLLY